MLRCLWNQHHMLCMHAVHVWVCLTKAAEQQIQPICEASIAKQFLAIMWKF